MSLSLLQLTDITKSFGAVRALKGVSFELRAGEVHALLGENGAGKSTLIKIITGAHRPERGTIQVGGQLVSHLTPALAHRLGITCIYQQPALFPDLTVAENIGLRLESVRPMRRVQWSERRARAQTLLRRIGAPIEPDTLIRQLSMPEQQLVEIACALGTDARIVIMDEPTASLTRQEQHLLFGVVRDLRAAGAGIIYISHRLDEIFALADRVTVLRDGETVGSRSLVSTGKSFRVATPAAVSNPTPAATPTPIPIPAAEPKPIARGSLAASVGTPGANETEREQVNEQDLIRLMVGREVAQLYPPPESEPGEVVLALRQLGCAASNVRDVNLELRAGEVVGLAGLVGAGRTELARVLFGITPADTGQILFRGKPVTVPSPRGAVALGIAYVPEDRRKHGIILEMALAHNVTLGVHPRIFRGGWLRLRRERQLALHYMDELSIKATGPEALGSSLSGGNQQKVALSRWLACQPKLLILDEPTQGVDVWAKSEIHKIIRRLAGQGMAVLMISSDLPEVVGMSNRIAVMRGGTIVDILPGNASPDVVMTAALGQDRKEASSA